MLKDINNIYDNFSNTILKVYLTLSFKSILGLQPCNEKAMSVVITIAKFHLRFA